MTRITKKDIKYLKKYIQFLRTVPETIKQRENLISEYLPELNDEIVETNDIETKIDTILGKTNPYPNIFLASSLGFNKMTWSKNAEKILTKFSLQSKLKHPTFKNYQKLETLKLLLIKYGEKQKK